MSEELAWAAGFFDGEGSTGCYERNDGRKRRGSNTSLRVGITQHDREVLDRFAAAVGAGKVYGPYGQKWTFQLTGKAVELVLALLWPWLSTPKRHQAERAFEKYRARPTSTPGGHVCEPDCTCGRQKWKMATGVDPKLAEKRAKQREYQRRHREKQKVIT